MTQFDLLVLDWSGVVSNDLPVVHDCVNRIMKYFGKPSLTVEELRQAYSVNFKNFYEKCGIYDFELVHDLYMEFLNNSFRPTPIPGAVEAVRELSKILPIAIFSSHQEIFLLGDLLRYNVGQYIPYAFGGVDKSKADDFKRLCERTEVNPERILYCGDTFVDITLAHLVGASSVAVVNQEFGYNTLDQIARGGYKPTHGIVEHIKEIIPFVKNGKK